LGFLPKFNIGLASFGQKFSYFGPFRAKMAKKLNAILGLKTPFLAQKGGFWGKLHEASVGKPKIGQKGQKSPFLVNF